MVGWQGYVIGDWFPAANQVEIGLYSGTQDGGETIILLSLKKRKDRHLQCSNKNSRVPKF